MYSPIKLSVSSILLAGVMTGCSQQQIQTDSINGILRGASEVSSESYTPKAIHNSRINNKVKIHKKKKKKKKKKSARKSKKNIGFPPAKPGQCYAKVKKAANYKTLTKRILVKKASSKRVFVRGAQYQWLNRRVLVKPASYTQRVIPAVYKTVTKRVMIKPSYLKWKKGKGLITRIDNTTGEILCRVRVPAVYKKVRRKVLVRAARIIKIPHAAIYKTIKNKRLISPVQYKTVRTPARYKTKKYRVKTTSAKYVWRQVICETNVSKSHKTRKHYKKRYKAKIHRAKATVRKYPKQQRRVVRAKSNNRQYLAEKRNNIRKASYSRKMASPQRVRATTSQSKIVKTTNLVPKPKAHVDQIERLRKAHKSNQPKVRLTKANAIFRIQTALSERGFKLGKIDGKLGPATVRALTAFQRKNGLTTGKLNRATLQALDLI